MLDQATASTWTQVTSTSIKTTVTSTILSGEINFTITYDSVSKSGQALILPQIGSRWGQPEPVPGSVNTNGWEDSPEISPDGKYLIISTYSPVSLFQCITDGGLAGTPSCNTNLFSIEKNNRPSFPGENRVLSDTSINHNISLLDPPNTTNAFPPVSSYLFLQQSDGSFREGKPVYIDWEAFPWGAPFGFNFRKNTSAENYKLYVAFGDPILQNGNRIQSVDLDFSSPTIQLGQISRVGGNLQKSNWKMNPISITAFTGQAGNPSTSVHDASDGFLFWDDETAATNAREIFFATETAAGVLGAKQTAGLANAGSDKYQPFFYENSLFYSLSHGLILSQNLLSNVNLANTSSWGTAQIELGMNSSHTHEGRVSSIGEPSLYKDSNGKSWLYFAYSVTKSRKPLNLNIGRVQEK